MKAWSHAAKEALWSGALASLASSAMLSACAEREKGKPLAPTNATSRWIWGDKAVRQHRASLRYTVTGYTIHHASSTLWALIYKTLFEPRARHAGAPTIVATGITVAALACFGDYKLTPYRFRPGFERHLSKTSLALSYGFFGLALASHTLLFRHRRNASS